MGALQLAYRTTKPTLKVVYNNLYESKKNCTGAYRYGFNGKENDNEVKGNGNSVDFGERIQDVRLGGRFLSIDFVFREYPWYSPYQFAGNKPIWAIDLDGLEEYVYQFTLHKDKSVSLIKKVVNSKIVASGGHGYAYINRIDIRTGKPMNPSEVGKVQYQYFNESGQQLKIRRKPNGEFEEGEGEFLTPYVENNFIPGAFPNYSTYIGPNNPTILENGKKVADYRREPTDVVDAAAQRHDRAYDKKKARGLEALTALRVLDADKTLVQEAQNIIDAAKENPNTIDRFTGKPISQRTLENARSIVKAFTIIINRKEKRLAKGEKPEPTPE